MSPVSNKKTRKTPRKKSVGKFLSRRKKFFIAVAKALLIMFIVLSCALIGILGGTVYGYIKTATPITPAQLKLNTTSFVYDYTGKNVIAQLNGMENRQQVTLDQIPKHLQNAIIAIEDKNFRRHGGIDIKRFVGAVINYVTRAGNATYGGSTITMQLVKNITKEDDRSIKRKIQEQYKAIQLERKLTKDQILELYLNTIPMGGRYYGVEAASLAYFNKHVWELSLAECASLAAIPNATAIYSPVTESGRANNKKRQEIILSEMKKQGYINEKEYEEALKQPLNFADPSATQVATSRQNYFIDQVVTDVANDLMDKYNMSWDEALRAIYNSGYKIYSTCDPKVQEALDKVFENDKYFEIIDPNIEHPQAAMVVIDPYTGHVRGIRGGYGKKTADLTFNRATQMKRSVGSSFKPIVDYAPAIDMRLATAATVVDDVPVYMDPVNQKGKLYPRNFTGTYQGLTTIRDAIKRSVNVVAAKVFSEYTKVDNAFMYLKRVGIDLKKSEDGNLSVSLGGLTHGISPLQLAAAYAPFVNRGLYVKPVTYTKVVDSNGNVVLENEVKTSIVYEESTAFIMTEMLKDVCRSGGTAYYYDSVAGGNLGLIQNGKMPIAGKTGTTNDDRDRWFVGYSHYYVAATWYGYDNNHEVKLSWNYNPALRLWHLVMEEIHKGLAPKEIIQKPDDVIVKRVCIDSGKVPTELCTKDPRGNRTRNEYFVKGTEPRDDDTCDVHVMARVCTASKDSLQRNVLAGPLCPASTVKEGVYIQRREPFVPTGKNDPWPLDWKYELSPEEYCKVHNQDLE